MIRPVAARPALQLPTSAIPRLALLGLIGLSAALLATPVSAGPLGPGIAIREIAAPPQLLTGVKSLSVGTIGGTGGPKVREELLATLNDPERETGMGTAGDVAGDVVEGLAGVGGQLIASKIPGLGGKVAKGATEVAGAVAADAIRGDKVTLADGLQLNPFRVVDKGGDAQLAAKVETNHKDENYTKKVEAKDDKGNVLKDAQGKTIMKEVSCQKRTVTAAVSWTVTKSGTELAKGTEKGSAMDTHCADEKGKISEVEPLAQAAVVGTGKLVAYQIAPAWRSYRASFKQNPMLKAPLDRIRDQKLEEALCLSTHIQKLITDDPEIPLARGAILEAMGHHDAAIAAYNQATGIKAATEAATRVSSRKDEIGRMTAAYGLTYTIGAPPLDRCPTYPEGRPVLAKKDLELTATPGGAPAGTVEKGALLFIVGLEGKDAQVAGLSGESGWVPEKSLK